MLEIGGDLELIMTTKDKDLMQCFRKGMGSPFTSPSVEGGHNKLPRDRSGLEKAKMFVTVGAADV